MGTIIAVVLLVASSILLYKMLARETGFRLLKAKITQSGTSSAPPNELGGEIHWYHQIPEWWKNRKDDVEEKRMFWYVVLVFICAGIAYFGGYKPAGIVAVVGLHVIWGVYHKKGSFLTKMIVSGILLSFALGWLVPETKKTTSAFWGATGKFVSNKAKEYTSVFNAYEKGLPSPETKNDRVEASTQPVAANIVHVQRLAQVETVFELTPDFNGRNMIRLPPMKRITYYCSDEGSEMTVIYSAGQINVPSGQAFKCPTTKDDVHALVGVDIRNASLMFRSNKPGATATVVW